MIKSFESVCLLLGALVGLGIWMAVSMEPRADAVGEMQTVAGVQAARARENTRFLAGHGDTMTPEEFREFAKLQRRAAFANGMQRLQADSLLNPVPLISDTLPMTFSYIYDTRVTYSPVRGAYGAQEEDCGC